MQKLASAMITTHQGSAPQRRLHSGSGSKESAQSQHGIWYATVWRRATLAKIILFHIITAFFARWSRPHHKVRRDRGWTQLPRSRRKGVVLAAVCSWLGGICEAALYSPCISAKLLCETATRFWRSSGTPQCKKVPFCQVTCNPQPTHSRPTADRRNGSGSIAQSLQE